MRNLERVYVFIASPSDVGEARMNARRAVERVNELVAKRAGIILEAIGWEDIAPRRAERAQPQPDILLAPWRDDFYASKRLSAEHALLVIEISDTTIRYDCNRKMPLYAKAGVRELWIENLQDDVILVYRNPGAETFATSLTFKRGESLSLTAFPEIVFTVDELLG
jgi:Uma2 family endonuclease